MIMTEESDILQSCTKRRLKMTDTNIVREKRQI